MVNNEDRLEHVIFSWAQLLQVVTDLNVVVVSFFSPVFSRCVQNQCVVSLSLLNYSLLTSSIKFCSISVGIFFFWFKSHRTGNSFRIHYWCNDHFSIKSALLKFLVWKHLLCFSPLPFFFETNVAQNQVAFVLSFTDFGSMFQ